jgi:hypothetical protein
MDLYQTDFNTYPPRRPRNKGMCSLSPYIFQFPIFSKIGGKIDQSDFSKIQFAKQSTRK